MTKAFHDHEECMRVVPWSGGHRRPSLPKVEDGWSELKMGVWGRQGWSVVECEVDNCIPRSKSKDLVYRVFPPHKSKHVGTFMLLNRAKVWVDRQLRSR